MNCMSQQQLIGYAIGAVIFLAVVSFRILRARRPRPLKVNGLWIAPAIMLVLFGALTAWMLSMARPLSQTAMLALVGSLLVGAAIGWWRGKFTRIEVDPESGSVTSQATSMGFVVLIVLFVARIGAKFLFMCNTPPNGPVAMQVNAAFLLFAVGLLCVASFEIATRARRLIAAAKAA